MCIRDRVPAVVKAEPSAFVGFKFVEFIVPEVITLPLIEVTFAFTSPASIGVLLVVPSVKAAPLNVTSPLNPIACVVLPKDIV